MTEAFRKIPTLPRPLSEGERSWISKQIHALAPFVDAKPDRKSAMAVVVRLFAAHAFADTSDEHMKIKFEVYAEALDEMPTWAIAAAQRDWCSGHVEGLGTVNFAFPPSPGQLAILARRHLFAVRCDALRLQRLLGANVANIKPSNPDMMRRLLTIVPRGGDAA